MVFFKHLLTSTTNIERNRQQETNKKQKRTNERIIEKVNIDTNIRNNMFLS